LSSAVVVTVKTGGGHEPGGGRSPVKKEIPMTEKALAEEIAFYEEHFEEYRRKHAGRYLLIHGAELIGVYDDELEADYDGYRQVWRTGTEGRGYLVKKAGEPAMSIVEMPIVTRTLPSDAGNPV
jgi:hypothetical protein